MIASSSSTAIVIFQAPARAPDFVSGGKSLRAVSPKHLQPDQSDAEPAATVAETGLKEKKAVMISATFKVRYFTLHAENFDTNDK
jgi:hypothetical protein